MGLYWTYSFHEIQQRIRLKFGELSATQLCQYSTLVQVVSQALGGDPTPGERVGANSGSVDQAVAEINQLLRF